MKVLALVLLPAVALAAAPPAPRRITTLLVPMDKEAESATPKLETYMNESLAAFDQFSLRKHEELFGMPENEEAQASLKRGEKGLAESLAAFDKKNYEDAERKVRATLKELQKAVPAMPTCAQFCQATALYAAVLQQRGDVEEARLALLDLLALDPTFELDVKRYSKELITLRAQVATSRNAALRGSVLVKSQPAGARVYVDGQLQGYTPVAVPTLAVGKHLLRLERPGYTRYGDVLEVTPDDGEVSATLAVTDAYKANAAQMEKVAVEMGKNTPGAAMTALGKSLGLERALLGTVRTTGSGSSEITVGYYELGKGTRLGGRRMVVEGDEYGQLKSEMIRLVNHLINNSEGGGEKAVQSSDPLENRHGMEDWNAEDKGGKRRTTEKQAKSGDPLDNVSGMEEW